MSTNSTVAGTSRLGLNIAVRRLSRGSGTAMIPRLGFLPEEEKFEVSAFTLVRAVKMVVFPTVGRPTIPQLRGMDRLAVYRFV